MKRYTVVFLLLIFSVLVASTFCYAATDDDMWTADELDFMREHPVIVLGVDPKFVPFEFIDEDGEHDGIARDYISLISEKTGLQFEVLKGLTWPQAYDLALEGKVDALPAVGKTPEREERFLLSEPYYYFKRVIAIRDSQEHISGIEDLGGKTVAVQRNSSHHSYLLSLHNINLSLYDSVEGALTSVATGEEEAFIGNLATTNYLIRKNGLTNLRFISFEAEVPQALYFAVQRDMPELVSILNKSLGLITEEEKAAINRKWIDLDTQLDYGPILRIVAIVGGIVALVLTVSFFWILRLREEICRRKVVQAELEDSNCKYDEANKKLQTANAELEKISMVDGLTGISNRRYFDSFLEKVWDINLREKFPLALIMIDIDHFKMYNDTYGHLAGDKCLIRVAHAIDKTVHRSGDFVARYGGEEFSVILSNTTEEGAKVLAERIRTRVEEMVIMHEDLATKITVSLGVAAIVTTADMEPQDLINAADCALYEAKGQGRNRVVTACSMTDAQ